MSLTTFCKPSTKGKTQASGWCGSEYQNDLSWDGWHKGHPQLVSDRTAEARAGFAVEGTELIIPSQNLNWSWGEFVKSEPGLLQTPVKGGPEAQDKALSSLSQGLSCYPTLCVFLALAMILHYFYGLLRGWLTFGTKVGIYNLRRCHYLPISFWEGDGLGFRKKPYCLLEALLLASLNVQYVVLVDARKWEFKKS